MSFNYSCKRCLKEFKLRIDVARHLSRKHKCISLDENFIFYSIFFYFIKL